MGREQLNRRSVGLAFLRDGADFIPTGVFSIDGERIDYQAALVEESA